jgi:hypothetical protein
MVGAEGSEEGRCIDVGDSMDDDTVMERICSTVIAGAPCGGEMKR